ncbi:MAG: phosphoribosylamine--glycine ligase [Rhizobiaceae bacterium]|jgi:phosphoribosylamine--glycine ligase|nr:phosphoribosylamine--glycine ligase [Rhizobiaceae bacterium]
MNILLIGSGGREHALAWKIAQSPLCERLIIAPGNPGTAHHGENTALDTGDHAAVIAFCHSNRIGLVVVGPEAPLVAGLSDALIEAAIPVFGPTRAAAQLEGSKGFTKDLCREHAIPTAAYARFNNAPKAKAHARVQPLPLVIKADGLAAGKGVTIAATLAEALSAIDDCFEGAFGAAGAEVVIEQFLTGTEASFFCICDGATALPFGTAQDHKRVGDGDTGPNTGGMGAFSPAANLTPEIEAEVMARIIRPTLAAMAARGTPFTGVLYAGLMLTAEGPQLIEYNTRFGDPECQVLMMRLKTDIVAVLLAAAEGRLADVSPEWHAAHALTVVMAAKGYPGTPSKGGIISGIDAAEATGARVFHAGTGIMDGALVATGGRVLNVTAMGATLAEAQAAAYRAVDCIRWDDGFCRRDIGAAWTR